ncbi:MAG: outer membrane lipoprotein carrier protein LolA, partial [Candidatus Latescibacterota bacterium]
KSKLTNHYSPITRTGEFMKRICMALFCMTFLGMGTSTSRAITGEEVIQKVRNRYDKMKRFSADFEQTFEWKLAGETHRFKGKLYLKKPNQFRLETTPQTVVSDGKQVWTHILANQQVFLTSYSAMRGMPKWEDLFFQYGENYDAQVVGLEPIGEKECHLIELHPKKQEKETDVVQMKVWVDPKEWVVLKVAYVDTNGDQTTYRLSHVAINPKMDEALFSFKVPEGVDVVDMREQR